MGQNISSIEETIAQEHRRQLDPKLVKDSHVIVFLLLYIYIYSAAVNN